MNSILQLKGPFDQRPIPTFPGFPKLPKGKTVSSSHLQDLAEQLRVIANYWNQHTEIAGALISVHYTRVVAKSNRVQILLSANSQPPTNSIRGSKFVWDTNPTGTVQKHIFTHYIPVSAIDKSIELLEKVSTIMAHSYGGSITSLDTEKIAAEKIFPYQKIISKTNFLKVLLDGLYVERFDIDFASDELDQESIVTIFKTNVETKALLSMFGLNIVDDRILDHTTLRLTPDEIKLLVTRAPYLISMGVTDLSKITKEDFVQDEPPAQEYKEFLIPAPKNEPTIGVIDTQFDENVYFHEWVDYTNMLDPSIPLVEEDYLHGTAVSSIIVDGPQRNPSLEDGCGRFRVRHFGVATQGHFSSFAVLRFIRTIVAANRDIKVWNLSLGGQMEIKANFISPEAAELDKIQSEYDVIFIVAGTNRPKGTEKKSMKIGAPADSLNSLVVNAVDFKGKPTSYTRVGPVLSFFNKPDISYYGGDGTTAHEKIAVCTNSGGISFVAGTSFAAPWIARKMAYLIHIMGMSREIAKALIIDSAAGWDRQDDYSHTVGYGIVPCHINDIIHTADDEIRFVLSGTSDAYETYTYNLPIPIINQAHPFYARATLVYFPQCDRNQGVDYTSTEMDIHFGRIQVKDNKAKILSINGNTQADEGLHINYEEDVRKVYRKWDNVKHICDQIKSRAVPRKAFSTAGLWGLSIKTKERLQNKRTGKLPFGIVVTLREMNGVNRIDDFTKLCMARGWLVNKLDVNNQLDIYVKAEEDIDFD